MGRFIFGEMMEEQRATDDIELAGERGMKHIMTEELTIGAICRCQFNRPRADIATEHFQLHASGPSLPQQGRRYVAAACGQV
jgi:hypothetical protein